MKLANVIAMSLKHLPKGAALPSLKPNTLRLYSMHFCPYAQRTRLVLAHKQIPHEVVNVDLKFKPDWFRQRNAYGLVPVLEYNDNVVCESLICGDFLDEVYPDHPLYPKDPFLKAKYRGLMVQFEKVAEAITKLKSPKLSREEKEKGLKQFARRLSMYEDALTEKYFGGSKPGMMDFHLWPFFERIPAVEAMSGTTFIPTNEFPKINAWFKAMLQLPAVKESLLSDELHMKFFASFATGTPHYDAAFQSNI